MPRRITVLHGAREPGYSADSVVVTPDASGLAERISAAVSKHIREAIQGGRRPSGGPQRSLGPDERNRAAKGGRNAERGMGGEGRFPASIGSKSNMGVYQATGTVAADAFFDDWQEREASRGVEYLEVDGDVEKLVDEMIEADLKENGWI